MNYEPTLKEEVIGLNKQMIIIFEDKIKDEQERIKSLEGPLEPMSDDDRAFYVERKKNRVAGYKDVIKLHEQRLRELMK